MSEVNRYRMGPYTGATGGTIGSSWVSAEDFDAERALRLAAERQVGELREQLANTESDVETIAEHNIELQLKLGTAMGLLREVTDAGDYYDMHGEICPFEGEPMIYAETLTRLADGARTFLNTTSTEGKDHE